MAGTAAPDFAAQIGELQKQGATLLEAVGELNKPNFGAHATADTVGYFAGATRQKAYIDPTNPYAPIQRGMPAGYKNEHFKSFGQFIKEGWTQHKSADWQAKHASVFKAVQGMSDQVASDGGFLVLPEYNQTILERVYQNDLFAKTDGYTVAGNNMIFLRNAETSRANGSRAGGLRGYWLGEGATATKSKPTVKQVALRLKKLCVLVYLTQELIDDAGQSAEQYVSRKAADEFNFMLGDSVFNGTGAGMPTGILNSGALLSVTKEVGQAASTIVTENIDKMWARRLAGGGSYEWYHNQDCGPQLDRLTQDVGTGGVALNRPNGIAGEMAQTLKTAPRRETEFNATLGTVGDLILADLGQVISITKGGITQAASMHVEFLTDQMALRFTMRVDARPWEDTPITPFKGSNTQSAFVALATRS